MHINLYLFNEKVSKVMKIIQLLLMRHLLEGGFSGMTTL